jgi:TM2 domain-containing membrane protein YozV
VDTIDGKPTRSQGEFSDMSAPGWYPDPTDPSSQRYFDGTNWTESRAPAAPNFGQPAFGQPPYGQPAYGQPGYGQPAYGVSDKSAIAAGLLQLFVGTFGVGRFYIGDMTIGAIQLAIGILGSLLLLFCGIGIVLLIPLWIWNVIDAIMMFTGSVKDAQGRKLA